MANTDQKYLSETEHIEGAAIDPGLHLKEAGYVADNLAADYVDPTVRLSAEENKRLRRKIYKKLAP